MRMNWLACVNFTLKEEGGYVNDPQDPGGPTNMGITFCTLSGWLHRTCTVDEVINLTRATAMAIYHAEYWNPVNGDQLPYGIDLMVFDFGVNTGPITSAKMLQQVVGVTQDGAIGPITLAAVKNFNGDLLQALADVHDAYYKSLAEYDIFGDGWTRRVNDSLALAREMVKNAP